MQEVTGTIKVEMCLGRLNSTKPTNANKLKPVFIAFPLTLLILFLVVYAFAAEGIKSTFFI
jgi:hypothetical protein